MPHEEPRYTLGTGKTPEVSVTGGTKGDGLGKKIRNAKGKFGGPKKKMGKKILPPDKTRQSLSSPSRPPK